MSLPGGLGRLGDLDRVGDLGALPRTRRWPWALLPLLLLPLLLLLPERGPEQPPSSLSGAQLEGQRGSGCVRLAVLADSSGSMRGYAQPRAAAVQEILRWAPANLRAGDQIVVVEWAGSAATTLPPVDAAAGASGRLQDPGVLADGSSIVSGLDELAAAGASPCETVAVVVSDGLVTETERAVVDAAVRRAGVGSVVLMLPSPDLDVPPAWTDVLPGAEVVRTDGGDPRAVALALGQVLADHLGLRLTT